MIDFLENYNKHGNASENSLSENPQGQEKSIAHRGICNLFTQLETTPCSSNSEYQSNIRFVYITSRPISLMDTTRSLLSSVRQENKSLPQGPIVWYVKKVFNYSSVYLFILISFFLSCAVARLLVGQKLWCTNSFIRIRTNSKLMRYHDKLSYLLQLQVGKQVRNYLLRALVIDQLMVKHMKWLDWLEIWSSSSTHQVSNWT